MTAESIASSDSPSEALRAYPRGAVDEFVAAAQAERTRLEAIISDAEARLRRARATIGMHRVMVGMVIETQREINEMRSDAERRAATILADATDQTSRILETARADSGAAEWLAGNGHRFVPPATDMTAATIDLRDPDGLEVAGLGQRWSGRSGRLAEGDQDTSVYFNFLRGALNDDQPLGPSEPLS
jgi:hypothetical protein